MSERRAYKRREPSQAASSTYPSERECKTRHRVDGHGKFVLQAWRTRSLDDLGRSSKPRDRRRSTIPISRKVLTRDIVADVTSQSRNNLIVPLISLEIIVGNTVPMINFAAVDRASAIISARQRCFYEQLRVFNSRALLNTCSDHSSIDFRDPLLA